ncbi:hypothetical protein RT21_21480 [Pseudomonas sp. 10B238]|jgi:hypothetical protein|uniref:hypothetical protein n=1 Tax=Pseudomonadaceae TaxID=135621 RepID=UPI000617E670|nr:MULTISPECIES: hypothetical protein [Pseudomonadaceae]KJJ61229.1 hypothetical protein RT21_21480 [Pseudomonas sp. 10B238]MCQ2029855.1 hypothetical protein [Stutzerimonas zhaodongensis]
MLIDECVSTLPISRLIDDLKVSRDALNALLRAAGVTLLFHRPKNIDVWVSAHALVLDKAELKAYQSPFREKEGTTFSDDHNHCKKVKTEIKLFPVEIPEWEEITKTGQILKRSFKKAFVFNPSGSIVETLAAEQFKNSISPLRAFVSTADFFVATATTDLSPEEIAVSERQILIRRNDALDIIEQIEKSEKIKIEKPEQMQKEEWMSQDLYILNKASSELIAGQTITPENKEFVTKNMVTWLKKEFSNTGIDLLRQAALSVLPPELYDMTPEHAVPTDIVEKYPAHASPSLIMINEAAIHFWNLRNDSTQKHYAKKNEVIEYLTNKYQMTKRLATAVFTIIRLPALNITRTNDLAV